MVCVAESSGGGAAAVAAAAAAVVALRDSPTGRQTAPSIGGRIRDLRGIKPLIPSSFFPQRYRRAGRRPVVGNLTSRFVIESASYSVNLLINPG